jgi:hypothetical protein
MGHKFAAVDQENFHLLASLPFFQDLPMEKLASIMLTLKHRKVKMLPNVFLIQHKLRVT